MRARVCDYCDNLAPPDGAQRCQGCGAQRNHPMLPLATTVPPGASLRLGPTLYGVAVVRPDTLVRFTQA